VNGYLAWGVNVVDRLRGMFAIAIWDPINDRLVLLRDRVGKKPLYFGVFDGVFLFGSEIKALLAWPGVARQPNYGAIHDYMTFQYVPAPDTAFRGIQKLLPAHVLIMKRGAIPSIERYYSLPNLQRSKPRPLKELSEQLIFHLREATRRRLVADVPVGVFLSGGVDSSAVAAMMMLESSSRVKSFTIGFEDTVFDERPFARLLAQRYGADHHEQLVKPDVIELLPSIVHHYGEPFADSSAIPTFCLSKLASQEVKVALSGDGGDELFLGYPRYQYMLAMLEGGPGRIRSLIRYALMAGPPRLRSFGATIRNYFQIAGSNSRSRQYEPCIAYFSDAAKRDIYGEAMIDFLGRSSLDLLEPYLTAVDNPAAAAAWADIHTYLPNDLLVKVDVATMAHSLECRCPFLDQNLMEWAAGLPAVSKLCGGELKGLLKTALAPYVPQELLSRPKMGFGIPLERWLREDLHDFTRDTLLSGPAATRGLFNSKSVAALLDGHASGGNNSARIWALLMFELWFQMWIDAPHSARAPTEAAAG
jgi:asparagine synthase (glutamine-hydrolysing)